MQASFAPESTNLAVCVLSRQRLVDSAALHPPYEMPLNRRSHQLPDDSRRSWQGHASQARGAVEELLVKARAAL